MSPTVLLADPSVRIAGLRAPTPHRVERAARAIRLRWVLGATLLLLAVGALAYLRTVPPLATVMSGSMAPTIGTGDIVVLQRLSRPAKAGDVVMIHVPDEARSRYGYPAIVIHRVVAVGPDGMVTSKGDARKEPDPFKVPREMLTTRVVTHIPAAGQILGFFTSTLGMLWLGSGVALLFGAPLVERHRRGQGSREERDRALDEALQAAASAQALLAQHLSDLPAQIERAVSTAVAVVEPPAPEPVVIPAGPVPPTPPVPPRSATPDLMGIFARPAPPVPAPAPSAPADRPALPRLIAASPRPSTPPAPAPVRAATPDLIGILIPAPPRPRLVAASRGRLVAASAWDAPPKRFTRTPGRPHGLLCAVPA